MKNKYIVILAIILSLSLVACNKAEMNELSQNTTTDSPAVSTSVVAAPEMNVEPSYEPLTIEDYAEYLAFLDSTDLPKTFIPYEFFSSIGEFDRFMCLTNATDGDYSQSMYTLIDSNGWELTLYVEYRADRWWINEVEATSITLVPENSENLRFQPSNASRYLYSNNMIYTYIDEKLSSVIWYTDTAEFSLCNTNGNQLGDYPIEYEHDTFASKMLIRSEAQNALNALPDSVYQKSAK